MQVTVNSKTNYARPITYNELPAILGDDFAEPLDDYPVYAENENGIQLYTGSTNATACNLLYLHKPTKIVISDTSIAAGATAVTVGLRYAVDTSSTVTHNSVVYSEEDDFVAVNTATAGGSVILITNTELADPIHYELIKIAASILSGQQENYNEKNILEQEIQRS